MLPAAERRELATCATEAWLASLVCLRRSGKLGRCVKLTLLNRFASLTFRLL